MYTPKFTRQPVLTVSQVTRYLRDMLQRKCEKKGVRFCCPDFKYCTDNAAMIGSAGFYLLMNGRLSDLDLNATPYLPIC